MSRILKGNEVAEALTNQMQMDVRRLAADGITPTLCIFRVGERPDDLAYERGMEKRAGLVGICVQKVVLPADVTQEEFDKAFRGVNDDDSIHGILLIALHGELVYVENDFPYALLVLIGAFALAEGRRALRDKWTNARNKSIRGGETK